VFLGESFHCFLLKREELLYVIEAKKVTGYRCRCIFLSGRWRSQPRCLRQQHLSDHIAIKVGTFHDVVEQGLLLIFGAQTHRFGNTE
jgi:hypothetical protein